MVKPFSECRLYTFIDTAYLAGRAVEVVAGQLCEGESDVIQLRAKGCSPDQVLDLAGRILPITRRAGIGLVINDHPALAQKAGAFACHLGQEDFFDGGFTSASQVTGSPPGLRLGLSTHAPEQAVRGLQATPDYLAVGPVFTTPTKPTARPVGLDYVRWAARHVTIPWFAIGGITLANVGDVLAAGATRVCVVSAILQAPDVAKACRQFKEQLGCGRSL